ncbi:MAG: TraR/DksA C4-type zinc finger protein [Pseudomonadota bacterium]
MSLFTAQELEEFSSSLRSRLEEARQSGPAAQAQAIEDALARLAAGDFGQCVICDEAIGTGRLQAHPAVELCLACQCETELRPGLPNSRGHRS